MSAEQLGTLAWSRLLVRVARLAGPVVLASLAQTLMGLIDTLMVGRLGTAPIAAVGLATLMFSVVATGLRSLDVAVQIFTARRDGQGRPQEVGGVLGTGLCLVLSAGLLVTLGGLRWPAAGLSLISPDPKVVSLGADYYALRILGLLPLLVYFLVRAVCDGLGKTRVGMVTGIGMNLLNVLLNWLLIFGNLGLPAMGVRGAALASTLASLAAAVVILLLALKPALRRRHGLFGRGMIRRELAPALLRVGWPPALQAICLIGGLLVFTVILAQISTVALAAGNIVMRLAALSLMAAIGVSVVVQTLVSRSLGAGDALGAWRSGLAGLTVAAAVMALFGLPMLLVPDLLLSAFAAEPPVVAAGRGILRLTALFQMLAAVSLSFAGVLRGAGATAQVLVVEVATGLGFLLPATWLLAVALGGGLIWAWWTLAAWVALHAALMTRLFLGRSWLEVRI